MVCAQDERSETLGWKGQVMYVLEKGDSVPVPTE